jgi:hypothetical protein
MLEQPRHLVSPHQLQGGLGLPTGSAGGVLRRVLALHPGGQQELLEPRHVFGLVWLITLDLLASVLAIQKRPRHKGAPQSFVTLKLPTRQADKPFRPWRVEIGPTWGSER